MKLYHGASASPAYAAVQLPREAPRLIAARPRRNSMHPMVPGIALCACLTSEIRREIFTAQLRRQGAFQDFREYIAMATETPATHMLALSARRISVKSVCEYLQQF